MLMPSCKHWKVCGREALDEHGGKCILHSEKPEKDEEAFEVALEKHREEHGTDFRWVVFPVEVDYWGRTVETEVSFRGSVFRERAFFNECVFEEEVAFTGATFEAVASFIGATFDKKAKFLGATVEGEALVRDVTFKGKTDFRCVSFDCKSTLEKADFRGSTFEKEAHFSRSSFEDKADFKDATFSRETAFNLCDFKGIADFEDAFFGNVAYFKNATFEEEAILKGATFKNKAGFTNTTFKDKADFAEASFKVKTDFEEAIFKDKSIFKNATFWGGADFDDTCFVDANFCRSTFEAAAYYTGTTFGEVSFTDTIFKEKVFFSLAFQNSDGVEFTKAEFYDCKLKGGAKFTGKGKRNRAFAGGKVSFRDVKVPPDVDLHFRYADLSQCRFLRTDLRDVEFTGAKWCEDLSIEGWFSLDWFQGKEWFRRVGLYDEIIEDRKRRSLFNVLQTTLVRIGTSEGPHWTLFEVRGNLEEEDEERWREVERLYRQLKRNYEERGDFPRGGDFHIGEKEARRKSSRTSRPLKFLLYAYRTFSKYGERAIPAATSLLMVVLGCAMLYSLLDATLVEEATGHTFGIADPGGPLTFSESLRVSLEASFYPVRPIGFEGLGTYIVSVVQRLLSPVLIALLALALRQRVKR